MADSVKTAVIDAESQFKKSTQKPLETDDEVLERLSKLSPLDYDRCREDEAENLGVRVSILDKMVKSQQLQGGDSSIVEKLEPHSEQVNLEKLLDHIEITIKDYAILPSGASTALSLWVVASYAINEFRIFPKLAIHSPEKRCGKSTVLDLVDAFSSKALFASSISQAAIYRVIEAHQPTLIIDEADTFIAGRNDEMIGIINSGHAKSRAHVIRVEGDNLEPKQFSTWAPMSLASIKPLQGTIMDRSVVIQLRRKMIDETVKRLPTDLKGLFKQTRAKALRWVIDNKDVIRNSQIEPESLGNDRAVDNWIPLFTFASQASEKWLKKCKSAYQLLNDFKEEATPQIMLLEDIRSIFEGMKPEPSEFDKTIPPKPARIHSNELVEKLIGLEERPWSEWKHGKPMTVNSLAKLLSAFNVHSKTIRIYNSRAKGYEAKQFDDAFSRYLPSLS